MFDFNMFTDCYLHQFLTTNTEFYMELFIERPEKSELKAFISSDAEISF